MITETETKDKPSGKNVFTCCCPCIPSKSSKKEKKKKQKAIPKEFAEYEYVIENLAISKAPKICLDCAQPTPKPKKKSIRTTQTIKPSARDCSTLAVKTSPQEVVLGPVVQSTLSSGDCSALKEPHEKIEPCCPCPRGPLSKQMQYRCMIRDKIKDDFILKKILLPPGQVQRIEHPKLQNVPDIHKNPDEDSTMRKELKAIPAEIQKTIDALKIAKPQLGPSSLRRNRLNLIRSVSDTSCDNKETICNFLGVEKNIRGETTEDTKSSVNDYCYDNKRKSLSKLLQSAKKTFDTPRTAEDSTLEEQTTVEYYSCQIFGAVLVIKHLFLIVYLWVVYLFYNFKNS